MGKQQMANEQTIEYILAANILVLTEELGIDFADFHRALLRLQERGEMEKRSSFVDADPLWQEP